MRGAGLAHYGAVAEIMAGVAVFAAVLCALPARLVLLASLTAVAIIASVGLCQLCCGEPPIACLLNVNHFGCFIGMSVPMVLGIAMHYVRQRSICAGALALFCALMICLLAASKCRTALAVSTLAMMGMGGVYAARLAGVSRAVSVEPVDMAHGWRLLSQWRGSAVLLLVVAALAGSCAAIGFSALSESKSLSATGRVLIWRLGLRIARDNWPNGLGFGNFGRVCNLYQASLLSNGREPVPLRMAAGQIGHAFSEPLELWAEVGVCGFIIVIALGVVIMCEVGKLILGYMCIKHEETSTTVPVNYGIDIIAVGMAFAVLSFLLLSLVHFPRKIMPTLAVFNVALAWVMRVNAMHGMHCTQRSSWWCRWFWAAFWAVLCVGACTFTPYHVRRYMAARQWSRAVVLAQDGDLNGALAACERIQARLGWNGKFRAFQGDVLLSSATDTNCPAPTSVKRATELYEHAKYSHPYPYMFENLAVAYLRLANGTSWPVFIQTQYRMETPAQTLVRRAREWRCGTNLFFEPPPTALTQSDCIGRAIDYLTLASNILPWRLTSRWYLAQVYRDVGDVSNAVKYAQLVVNIPMKKDTPQGREFKRKAQNMLNVLGVRCDDPGMVVFDIRDRRTWNEGKW